MQLCASFCIEAALPQQSDSRCSSGFSLARHTGNQEAVLSTPVAAPFIVSAQALQIWPLWMLAVLAQQTAALFVPPPPPPGALQVPSYMQKAPQGCAAAKPVAFILHL